MLYLASQSPRRRELFGRLGVAFETVDLDLPEVRGTSEAALDYVSRVAREKAGAGLLKLSAMQNAVVLGADTEVVLDDEVFGKPRDAAHAAQMLEKLAGRTHRVISCVWLVDAGRDDRAQSITEVTFGALSSIQIQKYIDSNEWLGKAGAYAIQGRAEIFASRIEGSYSGVMGLPLFETAMLLRRFDLLI